jgi:hypothetical protein
MPGFCHGRIAPLPYLPIHISAHCVQREEGVMGTTQDHRRHAELCMAKARMSDNEGDKALWLTLAQSWARLAENVSQHQAGGLSDGAVALAADAEA